MKEEIAGVVLAGGLSRRMGGGDKGLLKLAGRPILSHVVSRLAPQIGMLALNANGDTYRFHGFGLPVLADTVEGFPGPLAGVLAGLEWAATHRRLTCLISAAGDTPFLPSDLVERLVAATSAQPGSIAVACSGGRRHPVFALWPISLRASLADELAAGERKVSAFIDRHAHVEVEFPLDSAHGVDPFYNINTPQDLAEAERILGVTRNE
jgi:molybdopterin-guanine dinucleotide biosynthesis protein A